MEKYKVTGMSCAACSSRVEKAVSAVDGVSSCAVNLLTGSMAVEGTASSDAVISAVVAAGYGASAENGSSGGNAKRISGEEKTQKTLIARLISSVVLLLVLMYLSMGHVMWGWPLPEVIARNPMAVGLLEMILAATVMVINQKFFINGAKGLIKGAPNMDTLVGLGSASAFIYSTCMLFEMSDCMYRGDLVAAKHCLHGLYFESAAMILALITVGKMLESRAKGKTTDALEGLMKLTPKTATVLRDGEEVILPVEQIRPGDQFLVRPGETVPVDGRVLDGHSAVNEAALTGESIPADKEAGDTVSSGTLNQSGVLRCEASRVGEDTTLAQIIKMVSDAAATKAPIAKIADRVSGVFVPMILILAVLATGIWLAAGEGIGYALARGISVLVISCPCALGLATPVAIMVGTGVGAKTGILFKTATSLEITGKIKTVALDKTGTVTEGHPEVTDCIPAEGIGEAELLTRAASLERHSEHPLAEAVRRAAETKGIALFDVTDFQILPGNGLVARFGEKPIVGGNLRFIRERASIPESAVQTAQSLAEEGKTPLFFAFDGRYLGIIAVADTVKADSADAISELKHMGIRVVMLTGDNERTAAAIGRRVGVDEVVSGVLPEGKEKVIRDLQSEGAVAMVGDGINDAPALTRADVGIAIGAGTDIAINSADVVLVHSRLSAVPSAIRLSRNVLRNIRQNLFWAFFYNALCIPLAAGAFVPLWGLTLNPMIGAAAMSLSSVCVVSNALRLNRFRPKKNPSVKIQSEKEIHKMKTVFTVPDMMCGHCEMTIRKALTALPGVEEIDVKLKKKKVTVTHDGSISAEVLFQAVSAEGFHPEA